METFKVETNKDGSITVSIADWDAFWKLVPLTKKIKLIFNVLVDRVLGK